MDRQALNTKGMNTDQEEVKWRLQSNRQLKEWSDQVAVEIKIRYALGGRHKQESSWLLLNESNGLAQTELAAKQAEELNELKHQNSETRIAIQKRHSQENADYA